MERITTAEAARRLGVSSTQVRRLIDAGKLVARKEPRAQGSRYVVLWDTPPDEASTPPDAPTVATSDATEDATGGARLEDEVRWLRAQLEVANNGQAELRRMLNLEQQTVAALRAQLPAARNGTTHQDETRTPREAPPAYVPELLAASPPPTPDVPTAATRRDSGAAAADRERTAVRPARRPWWRWWR